MKSYGKVLVAFVVFATSSAVPAADSASTGTRTWSDSVSASTPTASATPANATRVEDKIASQFAIFAGSQDNSRSLVTGLRQGSEITLDSPAGGGQAGSSATFTPPTRPMGYGNVRISLALAQEQLIRLGITQPTAEQLTAALNGGAVTSGTGSTATTTQLQGVLQMRAQGMGWGQIANAMGTKLGHVMSGLKQTNQQLATGQPVPGTTGSAGITTAAGAGSGAVSARGQGRGTQARGDGEAGAGIVTAAGGPAATNARFQAGGDLRGAGVVTGVGTAVGSRASAAGMANGKGHAKP